MLTYADLTDEQRADLAEQVRKSEERRQKRDLRRAELCGRLSVARDREDAFLRRLSARNKAQL